MYIVSHWHVIGASFIFANVGLNDELDRIKFNFGLINKSNNVSDPHCLPTMIWHMILQQM